jgi:inhibitor of KinA
MKSRVYVLSERALTVEVGEEISEDVLAWVMAVQQAVMDRDIKGVLDVVTAYTTVTVFFDPVAVYRFSQGSNDAASDIIKRQVEDVLEGLQLNEYLYQAQPVVIPVCYDEAFAPDLAWVAEHHHTSVEAIVEMHTASIFTVFMIGFTPGFPYMGVLPDSLQSPRKAAPRMSVPAGSVGLAGKQTGIYPYTTPGGWQIIGRTPLALFDPKQKRPALLKAGDRIRFEAISSAAFNRMRA